MSIEKIIDELEKAWSFDQNQQHTHTWHTKRDFISWLKGEAFEKRRSKELVPLDEVKVDAWFAEHAPWANSHTYAKLFCQTFVTKTDDKGPSEEEIYIELCLECGNKERGDLLNSREKELELMRYAKAIRKLIEER